jgi:hypothetical protein
VKFLSHSVCCAGYTEMIYSCVIEQRLFSHKSNIKLNSVKVATYEVIGIEIRNPSLCLERERGDSKKCLEKFFDEVVSYSNNYIVWTQNIALLGTSQSLLISLRLSPVAIYFWAQKN